MKRAANKEKILLKVNFLKKDFSMKNDLTSLAGKTVFVGLDVHKKTYSLSAIVGGSEVLKITLEATPSAVADLLHKRFGTAAKIHAGYEAGFCGFGLQRYLESRNIQCSVVNASSLHVAVNDRVKTDARDSRKIAEELSCGRIKSIHIPSRKDEFKRQITRRRQQIVAMRGQTSQQIKSFLMYYGVMDRLDDSLISRRYLKKIEEKMADVVELKSVVKSYIEQWEYFTRELALFRKLLQQQADLPEEKNVLDIYESTPGIGLVSARILANELGDLSRFQNEKKLFSYTGLTPCEYSSGEKVRRGHISRQGPSRIRALLVEVAWRAVTVDSGLKQTYENLKKRIGAKKAIVAMARRIIGKVRACFRTNTKFNLAGGVSLVSAS